MGPSRTQPSAVCCPICNQSFGRQEHLTRHVRIHTREKPYQCSLCEKRFSRLDVLNRHTALHEESGDSIVAAAPSRACRQCAADRIRCSRGQPCRRCTERMLPCQYPTITSQGRTRLQSHFEDQDQQMQHTGADQLAAGLDTHLPQITSNSSDIPALTSLAPPLGSSSCDPNATMSWMGPVGGIVNLYDNNQLEQSGLGVSIVNWMSPEYDLTIDWDALLSGYAVNNSIQHGMQVDGSASREEESEIRIASTSQDLPRQLQTGPDSEDIRSRSVVGSAVSSNSSEGRYYVDGSGARAPFGGRSHNRDSIGIIATLHEAQSGEAASAESPELSAPQLICSTAAYGGLVHIIEAERQRYHHTDIPRLPSRLQMEVYVRHYFNNFHPIFPFLRKYSFVDDALTEPLLLLAVSVVGSRYTRRLHGSDSGEELFRLLDSILRRRRYGYAFDCGDENEDAPFIPDERVQGHVHPSLQMTQTGILHVMCMMHSGKKALVERAFVDRHFLVEACHSLGLISQSREHDDGASPSHRLSQGYIDRWVKRESETRTGMMIWFLDSIFLYEFDAKPLIQLDDIKATLPSHDDVWESPDVVEHGKKQFSDTTLSDAMEIVYMKKRLPPHLGEFSIGLLINAIYRNTMNIMAREQVRLNSWTPTAMTQEHPSPSSAPKVASPTTLTSSRWRNSACDCLDVLHWPANSKVAQLSGSEHHTILHLHLARLIILTPTTHIQTFATESAQALQHSSNPHNSRRYATARQQVLHWVLRDRFKARLSIVHCGALYWHVRRYSCDSVLEPHAIYMATLVLWAFCVSMEISEVVEASTHENEDEPEPSFLHLDRPLDDELVQTFVRLGHKMSAYIAKVGNIHSKGAPAKILREGISLLTRDSHNVSPGEGGGDPSLAIPCYTWGIEESFVTSLRGLLHTTTGIGTANLP